MMRIDYITREYIHQSPISVNNILVHFSKGVYFFFTVFTKELSHAPKP